MHLIYDNNEATGFIKQYISQEIKNKVTDDDIDYIVSLVFDYYEQEGFLENNTNEETIIEIDEKDITSYVLRGYEKNKKTTLTTAEIKLIIHGELAYCDSLGIFE